jgi:manganese transport system permease protein
MLVVSSLIGASTGLAGLVAAYQLNVSSGSFIVCVMTALFALVLLFEPRRGLIVAWLRRGGETGSMPADLPQLHGH